MKRVPVKTFQKKILGYYDVHGRDLPWRKNSTPYRVLVSEMMLQQTQVDRVKPKFEAFIKKYPNFKALANAEFPDVLLLWSGLGYNRRAKYLYETAKIVSRDYAGKLPSSIDALKTLPGIGPYTAGAIAAFAHNSPEIFIETNIRSVYIHEFFNGHGNIHDKELLPLIEKTLYVGDPRTWYFALMDYGAHLKKVHPNPNRKSSHHVKQSTFAGSDRQIRGNILKILLIQPYTLSEIVDIFNNEPKSRLHKILNKLVKEKMITTNSDSYQIVKQ